MESLSINLFLKTWEKLTEVPRPYLDAAGLPENSTAVFPYYEEVTRGVIRKLIEMVQGGLVRLDAEGYLVPNLQAIHALQRHDYDVQMIPLGPDRFIARIARDDRSLEVSW